MTNEPQTLEVEQLSEVGHGTCQVAPPLSGDEVVSDDLDALQNEILVQTQMEALHAGRRLQMGAAVWIDALRSAGRRNELRVGMLPPVSDEVAKFVAESDYWRGLMEEVLKEYSVTHVNNRANRRAADRFAKQLPTQQQAKRKPNKRKK